MATQPRDLTPKQKLFVSEYLTDCNATAAYKRAGYCSVGKAAENNASRLMGNDRVMAAIAAAQARRARDAGIEAVRVLKEEAMIAFSDVGEILDFSGDQVRLRPARDIPESARRAIASIKVKRRVVGSGDDAHTVEVTEFKLWPKGGALDRAAKHLGCYRDKPPAANDATQVHIYLPDKEAVIKITVKPRLPEKEGG